MFPVALLSAPPDVLDLEVDGRPGAQLDLAIPELLERLSIALHRHDRTGALGPLFRSLSVGGSPDAVRVRTRSLLANRDVRDAMQVGLERLDALAMRDDLEDAARASYDGPDDKPDRDPDLDLEAGANS